MNQDARVTAPTRALRVALLGCGTVGRQVAGTLLDKAEDLAAKAGCHLELIGIAVRNVNKPREGIPPELLTDDAAGLVANGGADIVIELIGGIDPPRELIVSAINHGASVVTANKALLAAHGEEIYAAAEKNRVDIYFEAAVAGAIPIVRPLRESLVGDEIRSVMGIVNGTTNYILDKMTNDHQDFEEALATAQQLGYAEQDPTADVEGYDAAAKAAILAGLAFHSPVSGSDVFREGITSVSTADIEAARASDCVVKLLAIAKIDEHDRISVRVHPAMVPYSHPLAMVNGPYNAIFVEAANAGRLMFMGPGAGGSPTASAVTGDLVTVARNRMRGVVGPAHSVYQAHQLAPMGETRTRYYVRFRVADQSGVLASVASLLAKHHVSVHSIRQTPIEDGREAASARVSMMTHEAQESDMMVCLEELEKSDYVLGSVRLMRAEGA
ncbi:homoserine dehydrogenase [Propionibacterium freudenreichii]|uniref:Homoserine dehydrogenase n=1 Tax=Propionibacterium freudenreichii TaxID=1744 RepID=A0A0A8Q6A3_9ACTN|nr:homoserine dehydrogenase [Propionibacterium freudenreichii]ARO11898.1 homoserine dehydrogenase [Propionibacterium freudenreichii]AWY95883.1 Homoserine dehydrogenase [Propionibacterium freudenreichii]MCT3014512.1 homoserine dehydrogenase [Propionibacterium freudenreichii]MCT3017539.1 homoserine dehydrogenase [Propionibacterium freudenreichii]MDK9319592.1 homoserine dehydrogenase [Propionibacterium freudenreichii]